MTALIYFILTLITVGALGAAFVPSVFVSGRADKRMKQYHAGSRNKSRNPDRSKTSHRKSVQDSLKSQSLGSGKKKRIPLKTKIFQAGMSISAAGFIRNTLIAIFVVFIIFFFIGQPVWLATILSLIIGFGGSKWILAFRRKRYQGKYLEELPNAVEAIVRGIKAGMPLNDSIKNVAKDVKEPVRSEFAKIIEQQSIGKTMMEAVEILYERVPRPEVNFFIVVIAVQQQAGGNLAEALGNLSRMLRDRKKMQGKVKALSSEAKASASIIGSLPFFVGGMVSLTTPDYLLPLFNTTLGNIWLGIGAAMLSMGIFIMNRMIQFDY